MCFYMGFKKLPGWDFWYNIRSFYKGYNENPKLSERNIMIRVIKVTEQTLNTIAEANGGVIPEIESTTTYFVDWCDEGIYNDIVDEDTVRQAFNFVNPEKENEWNEVIDK